MTLFNNITTDNTIADEKDSLGGNRALESNAYDFTIKLAYVQVAASEAMGVVLELESSNGQKLKVTEWVTSGKEKGCKNYYERNGEKHYLPGFNNINAVCLLALGKELKDMEHEEKMIPLYNKEQKKEIPTKAPVLVDLIGGKITLGVLREIHNKTKWNDATKTRDVVEGTVEQNSVDKVFRTSDRKTVAEVRGQVEEAQFYAQWTEKNAGKDRDKTKAAAGGNGTAGAPAATKPKQSLFAQ